MAEDDKRRGWYDAADVRKAANGHWHQVLVDLGVRGELLNNKHGPCPGCNGRDRFRFDDRDGDGTWICSQGGGGNISGDGLSLLMHVKNWEWKRAVEEVGRLLLPDNVRSELRRKPMEEGVAREPVGEKGPKHPPYDPAALERFIEPAPIIDRDWIKRRSVFPVDFVTTDDFLSVVFAPGERALIFTDYYSQGDFLFQVAGNEKRKHRDGSWRLARDRNIEAVPSKLPTSGREGIWYLANPVKGSWEKLTCKVRQKDGTMKLDHKWTRRSELNVTRFPHFVLESDNAPEEMWIRALIRLELPITAIYSSGGRSLHALIKLDVSSKPEWDAARDYLAPMLCPLGADGGAMSAVRLTRLPGCLRAGKKGDRGYRAYDKPQLQELIYLNPAPEYKPIMALRERRNA